MIRGDHIEMVGYGLIRKTDYKMYEKLPHSEGEGGGGGWRFSLLASASACYDVYSNHYDAYNKHCKVNLLETLQSFISRKYLSIISYVELKEYIDYNKLF